jgi:3-keto-disaccharide hydrolase
MDTTGRRHFLAMCMSGLSGLPLAAQQAGTTPYVPKQSDRPEVLTGDEPGFRPIFDGKTLNGWEGDPKYWRVAGGVMTGEITPETVIKSNTFLIWRGGSPKDFELKVDYRITSGGNSGINYRSVVVPDTVTPDNRFAMRGYQCDIDGLNRYTGNNYEEKGRLFLSVRGQVTHVTGTRTPVVLSSLGDNKELGALITNDWNAIHLIVRGNVLMHLVNGHVMCVTIDDDTAGRKMEGLIGVQVHVGGPMKIEYRNWRLKDL